MLHVLCGLCIPHDLRKQFVCYMKWCYQCQLFLKLCNFCRERMEKNHKEMWIKNRSRYGVKSTNYSLLWRNTLAFSIFMYCTLSYICIFYSKSSEPCMGIKTQHTGDSFDNMFKPFFIHNLIQWAFETQ